MDTSSEGLSLSDDPSHEEIAKKLKWVFNFFRVQLVIWVVLSAMLFYFTLHLFQHFWNFYVAASADYRDALKAWINSCDSGNYMPEILRCHEYRAIVYSYPLLDAFASTLKDFLQHILDLFFSILSLLLPQTYFGPICPDGSACRHLLMLGVHGFVSNVFIWGLGIFFIIGFYVYLSFATKGKAKLYRQLKKLYQSTPKYKPNRPNLQSADQTALAQSTMQILNHLGSMHQQSMQVPPQPFPEVARKLDDFKQSQQIDRTPEGLRNRPTYLFRPKFAPVNNSVSV